MNGKDFNSVAAALLTLLDAAPAEAEKTVRTAVEEAPQSAGRSASRDTEFSRALPQKPMAQENALTDLPKALRRGTEAAAEAAPVPVSAPELTAAVGETLGSEDAMEIIDEFFRRDSRRYDGGFDAERVL